MKNVKFSFLLMVLMLFAVNVQAQQQGRQMQQQMQQQQHMQEMMNRMNQMMERTQNMTMEMNRSMQQAQNEQMRNQFRMMHQFGGQLGLALGNMKNTLNECNQILQNQEMMRDRNMQQNMNRMQQHLSGMSGQMEEAVQLMERMTTRLRARQSQ